MHLHQSRVGHSKGCGFTTGAVGFDVLGFDSAYHGIRSAPKILLYEHGHLRYLRPYPGIHFGFGHPGAPKSSESTSQLGCCEAPRLEKHGPAWWKPPRGRGFLKCALNLLGALGPSGHCSVVNLGSPILYTYINIYRSYGKYLV